MSLALLLLSFPPAAGPENDASLLAIVPEDAYVLVHAQDFAGLRARAERNDWYRLLGSSAGEPMLSDMEQEIGAGTHSGTDGLLAMAGELRGETLFFDTGSVAGFATAPPPDRAGLAASMRAWLPSGDEAAARTLQVAGGTVELVAWPDEIDGWAGRAGHFAAFVDHPAALALYSGDDSAAVVAAVTAGLTGLGSPARAPLVTSYLENGGGLGGGVEVFVDFTPLVEPAEEILDEALEDVVPDPASLLGLDRGTWLHASADVFPGTRVECRARLHLPPDTLVSQLADTFEPLPRTLPADLPRGTWGLYALDWNLAACYARVREAYLESGHAEELQSIDQGLEAARGMTGLDPVVDVLNQLAGDFAFYFVEPEQGSVDAAESEGLSGMGPFALLGLQAGLVDGEAFQTAIETLMEAGPLESVFELVEIAGVEAFVAEGDDGFDGGLAFLPRAFTAAAARRVLQGSLRALTRAEGGGLEPGSGLAAALDEHAGACFLSYLEMTPLRVYFFPELGDDRLLPPLEEGQPARDPFDTHLVSAARRTADGFEFELATR